MITKQCFGASDHPGYFFPIFHHFMLVNYKLKTLLKSMSPPVGIVGENMLNEVTEEAT